MGIVNKPKGTYDVVLTSDATANPATSVGLILAEEEYGKTPTTTDMQGREIPGSSLFRKRWKEGRLPPYPPRTAIGDVAYAQYDPDRFLIWSQNNWEKGSFQQIYETEKGFGFFIHEGPSKDKYLQADGCDLRFQGVATLGMTQSAAMSCGIPNAGWEAGADGSWTLSAAGSSSATITTTSPRSGSKALNLIRVGADDAQAQYTVVWDGGNSLRSKSVTFGVYTKRNSGTGNTKLIIDDGISTTGVTSTGSSSYEWVSVTRTLDAAATKCLLTITTNASAIDTTVDDMEVIFNADYNPVIGLADLSGVLYAIGGSSIYRFNTTYNFFERVYTSASTGTSIVAYASKIYAAFGTSTAYVYGSATTWTAATGAGNLAFAKYFTVRRNQLWKSETATTVKSSTTDPTDGANWGSAYTVGNSNSSISNLYSFQDSVMVGKTDGLHIYQDRYPGTATASDQFINITNQFLTVPNTENFAKGQEWMGWLYLVATQQSFMRYNGDTLENLSGLLFSPRSGHTGRVMAMGADPSNLFLLIDTNTANTSATKTVWLVSFRELKGEFHIHTLATVAVGDIGALQSNNGFLYALGRVYHSGLSNYVQRAFRFTLPTKSIQPAYDVTPAIGTSGTFDTYIWDGHLPSENKAFVGLTLFTKNVDANHTIAVSFGLDGAADTTTSLGTWNTSTAVVTKFFDTISSPLVNAVGRTIQFRFTLTSNNTVSPELYAFGLVSTLRPTRVKTWELYFQIGNGVKLRNGNPDPESKATKLTALSTLETQVYPIALEEDFDGDDTTTVTRVQIIPGTLERLPAEEVKEGVEIWKVLVQEVALA